MARYIDAEELCINNFMCDCKYGCCDYCYKTQQQKIDCEYYSTYSRMDFCQWIAETPTADVVEVVHGEWIQHDEGVYQEKEKNWWHCSNCGNVIYSEHEDDRKEFHKWCGRCGAYMRGEDDAEIH